MTDLTLGNKVFSLDVKGKIVVIQGDVDFSAANLAHLRDKVVAVGGLGILYIPDVEILAKDIDSAIRHLEAMRPQPE
jgi:hypothetical protein